MPVAPLSIAPVLGRVVAVADACASPPGDPWAVLAQVNDPRVRRGVWYRLETVLVLAVYAVLAGACSFVAIAEWAADGGVR